MSRVILVKPRCVPSSAISGVMISLPQKREPSRRTRQVSTSERPARSAVASSRAGRPAATILGRITALDGLPEDLVGGVALEAARALVPAGHPPVRVKRKDGIVLHALDQHTQPFLRGAQGGFGTFAVGDIGGRPGHTHRLVRRGGIALDVPGDNQPALRAVRMEHANILAQLAAAGWVGGARHGLGVACAVGGVDQRGQGGGERERAVGGHAEQREHARVGLTAVVGGIPHERAQPGGLQRHVQPALGFVHRGVRLHQLGLRRVSRGGSGRGRRGWLIHHCSLQPFRIVPLACAAAW